MQNGTYYDWFKKTMSIFIELFFLFAPISSLYVFTSFFTGAMRIFAFVFVIVLYAVFVFILKKRLHELLNKLLLFVSRFDIKTMLLIIVTTMIVLKVIYTCLFYFDPTQGSGDVSIYNDLANRIINNEHISSKTISHLFGIALHLSVFKIADIPLHIGMFILFLIGTIANFFSFKNIVEKDKAFIVLMLYILMPSTILLTFIPTHEVLSYFYFSLFLFVFNKLATTDNKRNIYIFGICLVAVVMLTNSVSPIGSVLYAIMGISVLLSNINIRKKTIIACSLVISIALSGLVTKSIEKKYGINELNSTMNTYYILIHGANIDSLGEQVDGFPNEAIRDYLKSVGLENSYDFENATMAGRMVLLNQYKHLFTHPVDLIRLLTHKFYILWSGDHYSVEMAQEYGGTGGIVSYAMLGISALIYLFVFTVGLVYNSHKNDDVTISNCKLMVLGTIGITFFSVLLNKYGVPVTVFIYLIAFYRSDLGGEKI